MNIIDVILSYHNMEAIRMSLPGGMDESLMAHLGGRKEFSSGLK